MAPPRGGAAGRPLSPDNPVPFPRLAAGASDDGLATEKNGHATSHVESHRVEFSWRRTADHSLNPGGPAPFPGFLSTWRVAAATEKDGHMMDRVVGHCVGETRRGTAFRSLSPCVSIPFPGITPDKKAPEEDGHAASHVISHCMAPSRRRAADCARCPAGAIPLPSL